MPSQKILYEDEIEYSVSRVSLRRRYLSLAQIPIVSDSKQKLSTDTVEKLIVIKPIHTISWICIVISGLAWIFYFGGMPWTPLFWLRIIPIAILAILILGYYLKSKKRRRKE